MKSRGDVIDFIEGEVSPARAHRASICQLRGSLNFLEVYRETPLFSIRFVSILYAMILNAMIMQCEEIYDVLFPFYRTDSHLLRLFLRWTGATLQHLHERHARYVELRETQMDSK